MIFGDIHRFSPDFSDIRGKSSLYDGAFQISYKVHPKISLIGERFFTKQRGGPFVNDLWAFRLKTHFDFQSHF